MKYDNQLLNAGSGNLNKPENVQAMEGGLKIAQPVRSLV
jgi:hypothetical protein